MQHPRGCGIRFYDMVGEPYHGGDFMTLTQRAKEQQVPMTEEPLGGKMGKAKIPGIFFVVDYWILLIITRYWWIIGGWLVDDWIFWIIARFLSLLWYVYVCPHRMFLGTCSENTYYLRLVDDEKIAAVELPKSFDPCIAMKSIGSYPLVN